MGKFFKKAVCIYLDQYAVSAICDTSAERNQYWEKIYSLLINGVKGGKIVCPYSNEHLIETSLKYEANAVKQDINFTLLARRLKIRNEVDCTARYIMAIVRNKPINHETYFCRFSGPILTDDSKRGSFKQHHKILDNMTAEFAGNVNQIRGSSKARLSSEDRKETFKRIYSYYENALLLRFFKLAIGGKIDHRIVRLANIDVPYWVDFLFYKLISEYKLTQDEASNGKKILLEKGLSAIPNIYIRATLEAAMACNSKKETVNDQIDAIRLAGALPAVDIMLTDGSKANDVRDAKLDMMYNTEVFSGKVYDLERLIVRLEGIVNSQSLKRA
ncbi:hypothetical protein GCM10028808_57400 [Spirosoma migulaei]